MKKQIYFNGNILTMSEPNQIEALLVNEGKIEKIGSISSLLSMKDEETELIDLKGKTLMPGFIDPHSHLTAVGGTLLIAQLGGVQSFDQVKERMLGFKERRQLTDEEWLIGFGFDQNTLKEKAFPTTKVLDEISDTQPILICHASGHMGCCNSLALKKLGITAESDDPQGGKIGRLEDVKTPNGYLEENAFFMASSHVPQPTFEDQLKAIEEAQKLYLGYGITTIQEGIVHQEEMKKLKALADQKRLLVDVIGFVDIKDNKDIMAQHTELVNQYQDHLKLGGYKMFLDGSPQGKTAWLTKPYEGEESYKGYPAYQDAEVMAFAKAAVEEELQILTHCNGDAAADQLIKTFEAIEKEGHDVKQIRPVMIHAQLVRKDQLPEMKKIGMIPSYFVAHTYYWGDIHRKNLGEERAAVISPLQSTLKEGLPFTLHQDSPVIMPNMLETVWCAVKRETKSGLILGKEEQIPVLEALKAVTIYAAYQYFEEETKGSLEEGKAANMILLDQNPLEVTVDAIKDIKIIQTIVEGEVLFSL